MSKKANEQQANEQKSINNKNSLPQNPLYYSLQRGHLGSHELDNPLDENRWTTQDKQVEGEQTDSSEKRTTLKHGDLVLIGAMI
jgi:hypothetical protein